MDRLLDRINDPADLRRLDADQLPQLARELREFILTSVSRTGGHLSSNLGTVELAIALHYVFATPHDRQVFRTLLTAKGVGPSLALSLLSTLSSERLVRAIRERDIPTLRSVPRVGKKTADQLVLDLADKMDALYETAPHDSPARRPAPAVDEAVLGLVRLGYARSDAERAARAVADGSLSTLVAADVIRLALAQLR